MEITNFRWFWSLPFLWIPFIFPSQKYFGNWIDVAVRSGGYKFPHLEMACCRILCWLSFLLEKHITFSGLICELYIDPMLKNVVHFFWLISHVSFRGPSNTSCRMQAVLKPWTMSRALIPAHVVPARREFIYIVYIYNMYLYFMYIYIYVPNTFVGKEYDLRLLTKIPSCFTLRWGRPPACFWYVWWESHLPKDHSPSLDSLSFDLGCLFSSFVAKQRKIIMIMTWWNSRCRFHKGYASSLGHWIIGKLRATVKVLENTLWESAPWPTGKLPIYRPVSLWNAYV